MRRWKNELTFRLRTRLPWSPAFRPPAARAFEDDRRALGEGARQRATRLAEAFPQVATWSSLLTFLEWHEALYVLDWLQGCERPAARACLDVGSKNGIHLPALRAAVAAPWTLVELDAHRRYGTGHTRRARAEALLRPYPDCRFVASSVTTLSPAAGRFDVITWTLPFVFVEPLERWGLPARFFDPAALLAHVLSLLAPEGILHVVNQGDRERDEQLRLLSAAGARVSRVEPVPAVLSPFKRQRWSVSARP